MLNKYTNYPIVSFPQLQFFKPTRYSLRALLSVAINKKFFPEIKLNGGGDLCLPTLENVLDPFKTLFPNIQFINMTLFLEIKLQSQKIVRDLQELGLGNLETTKTEEAQMIMMHISHGI